MPQRDEAGRVVPNLPPVGTPATPKITDDMRTNARQHPDTWLYVIDEAFDPNGSVPSWAVIGAYPVNAVGEIVEDFHANDRYRPSPKALGFPEPGNELERLLQFVCTGHRPADDLPRVILRSTLYVYALSPAQRTAIGFHDQQGRVLVPAYTSKALVPAGWPHARAVRGADVVESLGGYPLAINPHHVVTAVVPAEHLVAARG